MEQSTWDYKVTKMPEPAVSSIQNRSRHRRGLSLDQGIAQRGHNTPICPASLHGKLKDIPQLPRPSTPVKQTEPESPPRTPTTAPSWNLGGNARMCKTAQSSPTKPPPPSAFPVQSTESMQRTKSLQGVSGTMLPQPRRHAFSPATQQRPASAHLETNVPNSGDIFSDFTFPLPGDSNDGFFHSPGSPMASFLSFPEGDSEQSPGLRENGSPASKVPIAPLAPPAQRTAESSPCSSPVKSALSPRPVSISSLNLDGTVDASIEETGISLDDIATFIEGPDPADNKWICTYHGCNRRFGRKENIKSHVQTHLGDRQYKCNHCSKCFVRGHDLKRHAKIHTGVKPYPCECGNSFARHDALTRHKQRGMCTGAFDGAVRRVKKGRPRKNRIKGEEREEKPSRIRRRAMSRPPPVSTKAPLPSESLASPLSESFDTASTRAPSPVKELELFNNDSIGFPPDVFTFTPPASPSHSSTGRTSPTRSFHSMLEGEGGFSCLSPTKRTLDDIPEETSELHSMKAESSPQIKSEHKTIQPSQLLWPTGAESTLAGNCVNQDLDVFTNHNTMAAYDLNQLPTLEVPTSTPGLPDSNHSTDFNDDIFFNSTQADDPVIGNDLFSASFTPSLDDSRHGFFERYQTEISSGAI